MHEPLTTELVVSLLRDLFAAFPGKRDEASLMRTAEVYRNNLQGVSGDALRWAVRTAIQEDQYFPKVARLRELSTRWTVANAATAEIQGDERRCRACGQPWVPETRWRPTPKDETTADGEWLLLESFSRDRCRCDPAPQFVRAIDAPIGIDAMHITDAPMIVAASAARKNPAVLGVLARGARVTPAHGVA